MSFPVLKRRTAANAFTHAIECMEMAWRTPDAVRRERLLKLRDCWLEVGEELQSAEEAKRARRKPRRRQIDKRRRIR